jgi:hypothetical protein
MAPKIKGGFVFKARQIQDSPIAKAPPHVREVWDYLIRCANWKDVVEGRKIIKRGQVYTSREKIRDALSWRVGYRPMKYTPDQIETAMKVLRKSEMITTARTERGVIVTIIKYAFYQDSRNYEIRTEIRDESMDENRSEIRTEMPKAAKEIAADDGPVVHTRGAKGKKGKLTGKVAIAFMKIWALFDYKKGRAGAAHAFEHVAAELAAMPEDQRRAEWRKMKDAASRFAAERPALIEAGSTPCFMEKFFSHRRWEDEPDARTGAAQEPPEAPRQPSKAERLEIERRAAEALREGRQSDLLGDNK